MTAYYNENDPKAAAWLRELIKAGELPEGHVDERSIRDVCPADLGGFTECHFFAGIGVWALALRDAPRRDGEVIWTGSCPCQPFSVAGEGKGADDERHLWPDWFWLIRQCRPDKLFGEQVAGPNGFAWIDLVHDDLEGEGYTIGAIASPAGGYGAAHIRERIHFLGVANGFGEGLEGLAGHGGSGRGWPKAHRSIAEGRSSDDMAEPDSDGREPRRLPVRQRGQDQASALVGRPNELGNAERVGTGRDTGTGPETEGGPGLRPERHAVGPSGSVGRPMDDTDRPRLSEARSGQSSRSEADGKSGRSLSGDGSGTDRPGLPLVNGEPCDWLLCRDGKWRPTQPGLCVLADGATGRVGRLRGYGNGLYYPQAKAFVDAVFEELAAAA